MSDLEINCPDMDDDGGGDGEMEGDGGVESSDTNGGGEGDEEEEEEEEVTRDEPLELGKLLANSSINLDVSNDSTTTGDEDVAPMIG